MKADEILGQLENLIQNLAIDLRYEKGDFKGGLCRINEKNMLIINSKLPDEQKIKILAAELNRFDLENVYVLPAIRKIIEEQAEELDHQT
ncbi:hypothetical protein L0128_17510 [candidate division KSB1 bacterium]|nr:hypothetical protein [candidate division KSB1 bacterium]